jgi:hypothetical protein
MDRDAATDFIRMVTINVCDRRASSVDLFGGSGWTRCRSGQRE